MAATPNNYLGALVEYLDEGRLKPALVVRDQGGKLGVLEAGGRERTIDRDLVLLRHPQRRVDRNSLDAALAEIEPERKRLAAELDLNLLWEVVRDQGRSFAAADLAELFFGARTTIETAVVLEALLSDRLYFARRHMEFIAQSPEQVERMQVQQARIRQRSESYRNTVAAIRSILSGQAVAHDAELDALAADLRRYLDNPHSRSRELTTMLEQAAADLPPAEIAFEILDRIGAAPGAPRFAVIGGLPAVFGPAARSEAARATSPPRELSDEPLAITIDDPETLEIDDALSCEALPDGGLRVRICISLVADFIAKGGALDQEAADRAATVYLPETTVRMLPDAISCDRASLIAGTERPVLMTEVRLDAAGEILQSSIAPASVRIAARLDYDQTNRILEGEEYRAPDEIRRAIELLYAMATKLRERRRRAGASLFQRRETKVRVSGDSIEIEVLEAHSPARLLVAEFMVLNNFVAARFAATSGVPIIYRVQPNAGGGDAMMQRPRLSLYPEFHAGIGLAFYAQLSSPIRRYADLVLQRQLIAGPGASAYRTEELMAVLAAAENAESEAKELERRAKRYWILRYLQAHVIDRPLEAIALRDGASAELVAYGIRGTLRGMLSAAQDLPITVRIARIDPLRGWLSLDYVGNRAINAASGTAA